MRLALGIFGLLLSQAGYCCSIAERAIVALDPREAGFVGTAKKLLGPRKTPGCYRSGHGDCRQTYGLRIKVKKAMHGPIKPEADIDVYIWGACGQVGQERDLTPLIGKPVRVIANEKEMLDQKVWASSYFSPLEGDVPPLDLSEKYDYSPNARSRSARQFHYRIDLARLQRTTSEVERTEILERMIADPLYRGLAEGGKLDDFLEKYVSTTTSKRISGAIVDELVQARLDEIAASRGTFPSRFGLQFQSLQWMVLSNPGSLEILSRAFDNTSEVSRKRTLAELLLRFDAGETDAVRALERETGPLPRTTRDAEERLALIPAPFWAHRLQQDTPARTSIVTEFSKEFQSRPEIHESTAYLSNELRHDAIPGLEAVVKANASWTIALALLHDDPEVQKRARSALRAKQHGAVLDAFASLLAEAEKEPFLSHEALALRYHLEAIRDTPQKRGR